MSTETDVAVGRRPLRTVDCRAPFGAGRCFPHLRLADGELAQADAESMLLKSEGFASSLYDPAARLTLGHYCREKGVPTQTWACLCPRIFCEYGLAFQERMVPSLDRRKVVSVAVNGRSFLLTLEDGETLTARRVVMAVGIGHFSHMPGFLAELGPAHATHSSAHDDLGRFTDNDVLVLGAGHRRSISSACCTRRAPRCGSLHDVTRSRSTPG